MIQARLRSLQMRLAVRLAIPYIIAMAFGVGILVYQAYDTAGSLNDRDLNLRAIDIARSASSNPDGKPQLNLPAKLAAAYQSSADMFAVRDARGQIIAASPPSFGTLVAAWPPATDDASYFRLKNFGSESEDYYGLSVGLESAAGPLSISVAQAAGANAWLARCYENLSLMSLGSFRCWFSQLLSSGSSRFVAG
jgi:hypothetical protein